MNKLLTKQIDRQKTIIQYCYSGCFSVERIYYYWGLNWISSLLQWYFALVNFAAYTVDFPILID